jgi:hypothetical protein
VCHWTAAQGLPGGGIWGLVWTWTFLGLRFAYRCDEAISFATDGFNEARLFRIVLQYLADLADCPVDAVVGVQENVLTPYPINDLISGKKLPTMLDEKQQQLHGSGFELEHAPGPT